jgi:hypothetical protein
MIIMDELKEMKKDFISEMSNWFKGKWHNSFKHQQNEEIVMKLQFDKMRALYYLKKEMSEEDFALFQKEILEKIDMLRNEMLFQKVTYYTMRFVAKKTFKSLGIEVCYIKTENDLYDVYERDISRDRYNRNTKYVMDEYFLKKYMSKMASDEYKSITKKTKEA